MSGTKPERETPALQPVRGWTVGDDRIQRMMILAFAIRHSMERPAIRMEGGQTLWRSLPAAVCMVFEKRMSICLPQGLSYELKPYFIACNRR